MIRRLAIGLFLVFVLGLAVLPAAYADGVLHANAAPQNGVLIYPGPAPCNTTLQACISAADGATVVITPGTYLTTSLAVTKAVSLIGGGANPAAVKLHPSSGRMIQYNAPVTASFVISNLTIENGNTTGSVSSGGGIRVQSGAPPLFVNMVISNNMGAGGGGLRIIPAVPATLINVTFFSNTSTVDGGGINTSGSLTLVNTILQINSAVGAGGGITATDVVIVGGLFERNVVSTTIGLGGALRVVNGASISGTIFLTNSAADGGGAYVGGTLGLDGGTLFSGNVAAKSGGGANAGAVQATNTQFVSNTAGVQGGGAFARSLRITNTQFISNFAVTLGGGAAANDATVVGGSFERNVVSSTLALGGGLLVSNSLSLSGTTFLTNSAVEGGGAFVSSTVNMTNAQFISNSAGFFGGGLMVLRNLTLTNSVFFSNTSGGNGGAAYVVVNATLNGGRFENNFAHAGSGALFIGSSLALTDTKLVGNQGSSGGAVTALGAILHGGWFERNSAFSCGALASISNVEATNTIFLNNSASGTGGGACIAGGSLRGVHFENNLTTAGDGGALRASGSLVISNSQFISNSASTQGGGLNFFGIHADVINSLFARNQSFDGAAIALSVGCCGANIVHVTIADTSLNPGQAIAVLTGTVGITDTIVVNHITAIRQSGGTVFEDYNLFFGDTLNTAGTVANGGHSIVGNPAFVNAAADNYHLGLSSAAIDRGINAAILSDFDGDARPIGAGFDIGFDERNPATFRLYLPLIER